MASPLEPNTYPSLGYPVFVDISPHQQRPGQPPPDFVALRAAGVVGVMLRAFEGKDPDEVKGGYSFETLRQSARAAGLIVGAYQYFRARHPGDWQAELLLQALGRLEPGELPPALDVEELDGQSASKAREGVLSWVQKVSETIEEPPIIYTGPAFWKHTLKGESLSDLAGCPLWIADYRPSAVPEIPQPFTRPLLWQTTDKARFAGLAGAVDANRWIAKESPQQWAEHRC